MKPLFNLAIYGGELIEHRYIGVKLNYD